MVVVLPPCCEAGWTFWYRPASSARARSAYHPARRRIKAQEAGANHARARAAAPSGKRAFRHFHLPWRGDFARIKISARAPVRWMSVPYHEVDERLRIATQAQMYLAKHDDSGVAAAFAGEMSGALGLSGILALPVKSFLSLPFPCCGVIVLTMVAFC